MMSAATLALLEAVVSHTFRIGVRIGSADPFWVQMREAVNQHAQQCDLDLVPIEIGVSSQLTDEEQLQLIDELLAQDIDALLTSYLPHDLAQQILAVGLPIIHLTETSLRHPLFVSPAGFYEIGQQVGAYLAQQLRGRGRVLVVGGLLAERGEDGRSRLAGVSAALRPFPKISLVHIPSPWRYERAYTPILEGMQHLDAPIDAIFGLSDSLALAARDAGRSLGLIGSETIIVGINGDPAALAAIADGSMSATVETSAADFGAQAVALACQASQGLPLPDHFSYKPRLVTSDNVATVALQTLSAIAAIPNRLVGVNRREEQQRLTQLETSLEISRRVGSILDRQQLSIEIADLIRTSYGYDRVQLFLLDEEAHMLVRDTPAWGCATRARLPVAQAGVLQEALRRNGPLFIPDTLHSHRFPQDQNYPDTRSRVVVPIRFGNRVLGLLDLHSLSITQRSRQELVGLQSLADQLGVAMRNAELYSDALRARSVAEKADQLKTRLLANVSHEFRTPLNVIVSYSQGALEPNGSYGDLPPRLIQDLHHVQSSATHLVRLIDDLLDLSRAEIDELDLHPEPIMTRPFLESVFRSLADSDATTNEVGWQLDLPPRLPVIQADPLRLRQILLNLLSNAAKFTIRGHISLGAEVAPPHLHLWVADTGLGVAPELQERIFEPFVTGGAPGRREGIGLGLGITRRLVALHGGSMTLESAPGQGSTFHVYLPLPSLQGANATTNDSARPVLLVLSSHEQVPQEIVELGRRQGLAACPVRPGDDLLHLLAALRPAALAWDLAHAGSEDWAAIQKIRSYPQWSHLPFILYGNDEGGAGAASLTSVVLKPLSGQAMQEAIAALRSPDDQGPILVVDDDPQACALYGRLVAEALPSYAVRIANGGAAALAVLAHEIPSLVILDLHMPDVDGFAVLDQIRAYPPTRDVPILILSGQILSLDDIARLDRSRVTLHTKDILSEQEQIDVLRRSLQAQPVLSRQTSALVRRAVAYLQQHHGRSLSRQEIAEVIGVSKNYLSQIFQQELGISPWEYLNRYRIRQARTLLRSTSESVTSVAALVGFDDPAYFSRVFRKEVGMSPRHYREQQ